MYQIRIFGLNALLELNLLEGMLEWVVGRRQSAYYSSWKCSFSSSCGYWFN